MGAPRCCGRGKGWKSECLDPLVGLLIIHATYTVVLSLYDLRCPAVVDLRSLERASERPRGAAMKHAHVSSV